MISPERAPGVYEIDDWVHMLEFHFRMRHKEAEHGSPEIRTLEIRYRRGGEVSQPQSYTLHVTCRLWHVVFEANVLRATGA